MKCNWAIFLYHTQQMILPFFGFEKTYEVECQVQGLLVCLLQGRLEVICGKFKYLMCCLI